mmetsp:Transcript_24354/g.56623  ORF Transcript_24354/g.56623 Transcript_24354/m.56623 type:complete len:90 (+) Transcript_24354:288-557(+)
MPSKDGTCRCTQLVETASSSQDGLIAAAAYRTRVLTLDAGCIESGKDHESGKDNEVLSSVSLCCSAVLFFAWVVLDAEAGQFCAGWQRS